MGNVVHFAPEPVAHTLFTRMELYLRSRAFGAFGCGGLHQLFSLWDRGITCPAGATVLGANARCLVPSIRPIGASPLDFRRKDWPSRSKFCCFADADVGHLGKNVGSGWSPHRRNWLARIFTAAAALANESVLGERDPFSNLEF